VNLFINDSKEPMVISDELFEMISDRAKEKGISLDEMFTQVLENFLKRSFKTISEYSEMLEDEDNFPFDQILYITNEDGKPIAVQVPYEVWNGDKKKED
jgi:hypothetical protein